jgi:hypothetical protein
MAAVGTASRSIRLFAALESAPDELGQVLALLRADGVQELDEVPLGDGDRRLLRLHEEITGRPLELVVACGECEAVNSVELDTRRLPPPAPRAAVLGGGGLREPTYADLVGLPDDPVEAERALLDRCVIGAPERAPTPADLELVDDSLAGPLVFTCVDCGATMEAAVDVERRVLELLVRNLAKVDVEVHLLARAYHWPLETIEALPDGRRSRLAELVLEGR